MLEPALKRYPISTLNREQVLVHLTVFNEEVYGDMKLSRSGLREYRIRKGPKEFVPLRRFAMPALWRPIKPEAWPDPLPEPAILTPDPNEQCVEAQQRVTDGHLDGEGWPYPHVRLGGAGDAPVSLEETEARLLRAIRTLDVILHSRPQGSTTCWPPSLMTKAKVVEKMLRASRDGKLGRLREEDYADVHVDMSDLRALPARFSPTPRDVSDVDKGCLGWMTGCSKLARLILQMRAAQPPFSIEQIAEQEGRAPEYIATVYRRGIEEAFGRARK